MKPSRPSLARLLEKARTAPPPGTTEESPLPPGTATRIAARWAATRPAPSTAALWERLSCAGLAVALLTGVTAFTLRPSAPDESAAAEVLPDLLHATLSNEPEG